MELYQGVVFIKSLYQNPGDRKGIKNILTGSYSFDFGERNKNVKTEFLQIFQLNNKDFYSPTII